MVAAHFHGLKELDIYGSALTALMVPPARFQRATSRLGGERSMQLSYGSTCEVNGKWEIVNGKAWSQLTTEY